MSGDKAEEKVEEVDLDALEEPAHAAPASSANPDAGGSTTVEVVTAAELEQHVVVPEYEEAGWLLAFPAAVAVVLAWNVDWSERRVSAEAAARRAQRAPSMRRKPAKDPA